MKWASNCPNHLCRQGLYIPVVQTGNLLFVSGQLPFVDGKINHPGKVPADVSLENAQQSARTAVINALAAINDHPGGLERVSRIVRLEVFVNSSAGFTQQAQVANGASNLLHELFGLAGQHTRFAVGTAELPLNAPVELALIVEVTA